MAYDLKYGNITVENEPGNPFGEDEPVFILRARDRLAVSAIVGYQVLAKSGGLPSKFVSSLDRVINEFQEFSNKQPELMKMPD